MKVLSTVLILVLILGAYTFGRYNAIQEIRTQENTSNPYPYKDSLDLVISNLYSVIDSLQHKIDTSKYTIIKINKEYEETYINLSNAPINEHIIFFSKYLSESD